MEPHVAKSILKGKANPLYSSFHLKYNMLLNLMKLQDYKPEFLIKRSFKQFQNDKGTPQAKERLSELEKEIKGIKIKKHEEIQEYFDIKKQIASFMDASREIYQKEEHVIAFLVPGRLIHLKDTKNNIDWGWGIVVNFTRRRISVKSILKPDGSGSMKKEGIVDIDENKPVLIIDVLIYVQKRMEGNEIRPGDLKKKNGMLGIVPVMLPCVYDLSKVQMKVVNDLNDRNNVKRMEKFYFELMKRFDWCPPSLDPIKEMMIDDPKFSEYLDKIEVLENSLNQMESVNEEEIQKFLRKEQLKKEYNELSKKALNIGAMVNVEDLTKMRRVLRRLDYIREDEVLKVKGNVASEISASDEIILTELLVNGNLHNLEPECIAAICSCLVFDESKNNHVEPKHPILAEAYGRLSAIIKKVAAVMVECKIDIDEEEYINSFKPDLVDITYKWCKGKKFEEICNMTDAYEGSIIRCFRRLEELLKQLTLVSKMELANPELYEKLEAASDKLKKGIVFASSLYL